MDFFTVEDARDSARRRLPGAIFDYIEGGAGNERGCRRNRGTLDQILFSPRALVDVSKRSLAKNVLRSSWRFPFYISPMGLSGAIRGGGDVLLAKAAARKGIPFLLSTASTSSLENVAEQAGGDLWFQLYVMDRHLADSLVDRALAAGCRKLVLTTDVPVGGRRPRDYRNGFAVPFRPSLSFLMSCAGHLGWSIDQLKTGMPQFANLVGAANTDMSTQAALLRRQMDASFDWDALARLRDRWPHQLAVKGIMRRDDATRCIDLGVDAIIYSNHGGRQLEDCPSPASLFSKERPPGDAVLVDGGIRSGAEIAKLLCLGADAVGIGRAALYGLAAAGQEGVEQVIDVLAAALLHKSLLGFI